MKLLSEEWFKKHKELLEAEFSQETRLNVELTEVYENCYGEEGKTIWIYYSMKNGMLDRMERGEGDENIPESTFRCFGDYKNYVSVVKGQLDPRTGIMTGKFTLEGNFMKAMSMLGTYMKTSECKKVPGVEF